MLTHGEIPESKREREMKIINKAIKNQGGKTIFKETQSENYYY